MTEAEELELLELEAAAAKLGRAGGGRLHQEVSADPVSATEAAVLGFGQGGTAFFGDELGGLGGAIVQRLKGGGPVRLGPAAQPSPDDTPEVRALKEQMLAEQDKAPTFRENLTNRIRQRNDQAEREQRAAYIGGNIAGGVASSVVPGLGAGKSLGQFVKQGAAYGAAAGLGDSDANLMRGEFGEAAKDTAIGAATGAALAPVGFAIAKQAPKLASRFGRYLQERGVNAGRKAVLGGADSLSNRTTSPEAIREALESKAVTYFGTTESASRKLDDLAETQGKLYASILDTLEGAGVRGPRADEIARQLMAKAAAEANVSGADRSVSNLFAREADNALSLGKAAPDAVPEMAQRIGPLGERIAVPRDVPKELGLLQAEGIKRNLQSQARYGRFEETMQNEAKREIASIYRQAIENTIAAQADSLPFNTAAREAAEGFVPVKQRLGRLLEARDAAERGLQKAQTRSNAAVPGGLEITAALGSGSAAPLLAAPIKAVAKNRLPSFSSRLQFDSGAGLQSLARTPTRLNPSRVNTGLGFADAMIEALNGVNPADLTPEQRAMVEALLGAQP